MQKSYFVYILANWAATVLYVGITNDLLTRIDAHAKGRGCAFTTRYRVGRLLYFEAHGDVRQAISREKQIKGWRRSKKEALIRTMNPHLEDLGPKLVM